MAADRLSRLGAAVGRSRGPWTTARVLRWYQAAGIAAPERATARHDLAALARDGLLTRHDTPGRRHFTPTTTTKERAR